MFFWFCTTALRPTFGLRSGPGKQYKTYKNELQFYKVLTGEKLKSYILSNIIFIKIIEFFATSLRATFVYGVDLIDSIKKTTNSFKKIVAEYY